MLVIWLGALLVVGGVRLSGKPGDLAWTVERAGRAAFGAGQTRWSRRAAACGSWGSDRTGPGLLLIVVGGALLLIGGFV